MAIIDDDRVNRKFDYHSERLLKLEKAAEQFVTVVRRVEETANRVDKNAKYLFGNGEAGLDERVRAVEKSIDQLEERIESWANSTKWVGGIVGTYVILEVVKFLMANI